MDDLTPEEFYEAYVEADREGDINRLLELDDMAETLGGDYQEAKRRAEETLFEEFQEMLDRGGVQVTEQDQAQRRALYRQKIRSGEVPLWSVLRRLARTAKGLANIYELAGEPVVPLDNLLEKMEDVRIAIDAQLDEDYVSTDA